MVAGQPVPFGLAPRDDAGILTGERRIRKVGRKEWKRESNYHPRSLAETQVFRFKTILGDRLQTRQIFYQFKELLLKSAILKMTHLGMPDSVKVVG